MFFWMIVFYCFFIYCAKLHGHLDCTGSNNVSSDSHKVSFDEFDDCNSHDNYNYLNDPVYKDVPGNIYNTSDK